MIKTFSFISTAISIMAVHGAVLAADSIPLSELIKDATIEMPVSTASANFLLGGSGENVPRLSSFRTFSAQVARAYDAKGKVANTVAAELAPAFALGNTTWESIKASQATRIWSRTTISFASKVGADSNASRSAVGVQAILYAPAMDWALDRIKDSDCNTAGTNIDTTPPALTPGAPPPLSKEVLEKIEACQKILDAGLTKWNQNLIAAGAGQTFSSSETDATTPNSKNTFSYWITAAFGDDIGKKSEAPASRMGYLLTTHARWSSNAGATTVNNVESTANQRILGLNFRIGTASFAGVFEYSQTHHSNADLEFNNIKRGVIGLEYRLEKDLYLTLGIAKDTGLDKDKQSMLAKLNWGFGKTPTLLSSK